jgi:hypothetical protein
MVDRWQGCYEHKEEAIEAIPDVVRRHFKLSLTEVVISAHSSFRGDREWDRQEILKLLTPEALTSAVCPRRNLNKMVQEELTKQFGAPGPVKPWSG